MKKLFILLLSVACMAVYAKEETFPNADRAANKSHDMLKEAVKSGKANAKAIAKDLKTQKKFSFQKNDDLTFNYKVVSTNPIENNVADDRQSNKQKAEGHAYTYQGNLTITDTKTKNVLKCVVNGDFSIKTPNGKKKEYKAFKLKLDKKYITLVPYFESEAQKKAKDLVLEYYSSHPEFVNPTIQKVEPCEVGYKVTTTRTLYYDAQKYTGDEGTVIFTIQKDPEQLDKFIRLEQTESHLTPFDNTPAPVEPVVEETEQETASKSKRVSLEDVEQISVSGFKFNSVALSDENKEQLDQAAQILLSYSEAEIELLGHSCDLGDKETNYNFGIMRAKVAKEYLVSKGVDAKRIYVHSYGSKKPLVSNTTAENRAQNRRVEIKVIK